MATNILASTVEIRTSAEARITGAVAMAVTGRQNGDIRGIRDNSLLRRNGIKAIARSLLQNTGIPLAAPPLQSQPVAFPRHKSTCTDIPPSHKYWPVIHNRVRLSSPISTVPGTTVHHPQSANSLRVKYLPAWSGFSRQLIPSPDRFQ